VEAVSLREARSQEPEDVFSFWLLASGFSKTHRLPTQPLLASGFLLLASGCSLLASSCSLNAGTNVGLASTREQLHLCLTERSGLSSLSIDMDNTSRRDFLKVAAGSGIALTSTGQPAAAQAKSQLAVTQAANRLPKWRGFNLQYLYRVNRGLREPQEDHFKWISDWGFDFVRMPMTYRAWLKKKPRESEPIQEKDVYEVDEGGLELVDKAITYGDKYGIHVSLCFHRAPGYYIGLTKDTTEPFILWRDQAAVDAFAFHWELFARRYKGVAKEKISFNLLNEAPWPNDDFNGEVYKNRIAPAVAAIRAVSPERIIIADGAGAGNLCVPEIIPLGIDQSVHCYIPGNISHYKVSWMRDKTEWPEPKWPGALDDAGYIWDRKRMDEFYTPWKRLIEQGIGVHMGETGGSNHLPWPVFRAWLTDVLEICKDLGIGYALWDFIGASRFGILDSDRADVEYEDWYGHKLHREMLTLLQKY